MESFDITSLTARTAVLVPAYFSSKPGDELVRHLLWMTLGDCRRYLPLNNVWVVVDGDERTSRIAEEIRVRLSQEQGGGLHLVSLARNGGKLWALREGMQRILKARPDITYVVARDCDGDHAMSEVPNLLRAANELERAYGTLNTLVLGARQSRHAPMGWLRGDLETLLDGVTLDALAYAMARGGRALDLTHCRAPHIVPDLSSGFKVFGRSLAEHLFVDKEPRFACLEEEAYWHYGPETVTVVEGLFAGAIMGEVSRLTMNGQPTSSFGDFGLVSLYGDLLAWVYARLQIPLTVAAQFFDNWARALTLLASAQGREILAGVRQHALETLAECTGEGSVPEPVSRFTFV